MADARAEEIIRRRESLAALRSPWEGVWSELGEYVRPLRTGFAGGPPQSGAKPSSRLFDATAGMANNNLAAGLYGMITNPANSWFNIKHEIDELNEVQAVKLWMATVERAMRQALAANGLAFYSRVFGLYLDLPAFGTAVFYIDEQPGRGLWYSHRRLSECFVSENDREEIDTVYRDFTWTARQAQQRWGDRAGREVAKAIEKGEPDRPFRWLHAVEPNPDFDPRKLGARFKPFRSVYVGVDDRHVVAEGGYDELPYQVPRWAPSDAGTYGDSAAVLAIADIKMVNAMGKTTIVGAQKAVDPPLLAPDEFSVRGLRTSPGGITYGGVDMGGNQLLKPLQTGARVDLGLELEEQRRGAIREAFHWSLLLMVQQPGRTATEVMEHQEEKLRLMAPHLGRIQAEFLDPALGRVFSLLNRTGQLPPPPDVLRQYPGLRLDYVSPLARAAKAAEGAAVIRTLEALGPIAQLRPEVMDNFDTDEIARGISDAYGLPAKMMLDPRQVEQMRSARAQQQQQAVALEQSAVAAGALKDMSAAGAA
ncbi:phage head-tail connector protein [Azospirillum sp. B510]|uniref:portal protein n=2 Tax=Alphaproteobacteria TaxID=28211 RepID=UPI0001C4CBF1|nr:portal protein [Azospirillum sp. B510]BAI73185.1 phage head-tail connector protein [Azospirillum sp. B510]